jgi:putative ABC transport system permease protein
MISARIGAVNGKPVDQSGVQPDAGRRTWQDRMRTREYFVSHRRDPLPSETIVEGAFWTAEPSDQEASLEAGLAANLEVNIGDTLTLDVQGLPLDARVTSFRQINWMALRPNSMIVLSPGPIEKAPGMFVASGRVQSDSARQALQAELVALHPNLTIVDATEASQTVLLIVSRVSSLFMILGFTAVVAGTVIVAGAIAAGRFAREREAMLFKVLGASRADLRRILTAEYSCLALLGVAAGWALAEALNRAAMGLVFDASPRVPYALLGALALTVLALNTAVGALVGRRVSNRVPLSVLRES